MLLIVSNKIDLATDFLVLRLTERGIPFLRVNTEDFLLKWEANLFLESDRLEVYIQNEGGVCVLVDDLSGAYIRQPILPTLHTAESDKRFINMEIGETLRSLWRSIKDDIWLNAPHNILRASNKPEQLCVAKQLGFIVPKTCVTADINLARKFYCQNGKDIIAKAVKHGFLYDNDTAKVAGTQLIDEQNLNRLNDYAHVPMIFQERIKKRYDLRVTVVGDKVFATAIYSQDYKETALDWRLSSHYKISLKHKAIDLPTHVQDLCRRITKKFQLRYSAIDLILAENGEYFFLELNPNGQWAWIEQMVGYPVRDAIINELNSGVEGSYYDVN